MSAPIFALTFATALGAALAAGVFFAFSTFVMAGLDLTSPGTAVAAMQGINRTAPRPPLMTVLFGTAALCLAVAIVALLGDAGGSGELALAGATVYLVGVIGVTMLANVPLNERLARVDTAEADAAVVWARFDRRWRAWNHVRTISGLAATAGMVAALAG
jgi:uncharacterized membrane protein